MSVCPVCPPGSAPHAVQMARAVRRAAERREKAATAAQPAQEHAAGRERGEAHGSEEPGASGGF